MRWPPQEYRGVKGHELWDLGTSYLERIEKLIEVRISDLATAKNMTGPRIHVEGAQYGRRQWVRELPPTVDYPWFCKTHRKTLFQLLAIRRELMYRTCKDYNSFRLAITRDLKDITNKLIFADWLQEDAPGIYGRPMAVLERKMRLYAVDGLWRPCRRRRTRLYRNHGSYQRPDWQRV